MKYVTTSYRMSQYIIGKYYEIFNKDISPIKLQKALYYCFAYYGSIIAKDNNYQINEYLFDDKFYAWVYGPVIPSIVEQYNNKFIKGNINIEELNNYNVKKIIDPLLEELFNIGDIKLVSFVHEDKVWIDNFDEKNSKANKIINRKDIIDEYVLKVI